MSVGASACGPRNGDYLKLENQWARVTITLDTTDIGGTAQPYIVSGDIAVRFRCVTFRTWREALDYAFRCLARYQEGRAS